MGVESSDPRPPASAPDPEAEIRERSPIESDAAAARDDEGFAVPWGDVGPKTVSWRLQLLVLLLVAALCVAFAELVWALLL